MRGVSALITADYLNRFSNGSPSPIRVTRDFDTSLWPDQGLALASLYPDSARDPAGDLWRYLVTQIGRPWKFFPGDKKHILQLINLNLFIFNIIFLAATGLMVNIRTITRCLLNKEIQYHIAFYRPKLNDISI